MNYICLVQAHKRLSVKVLTAYNLFLKNAERYTITKPWDLGRDLIEIQSWRQSKAVPSHTKGKLQQQKQECHFTVYMQIMNTD